MSATWFLVRAHLRRHLRSVTGLVLIAAAVGGLTAGLASAALRSGTALDRYGADHALAHADVRSFFACDDGGIECWPDRAAELTHELSSTPGVSAVGQQAIAFARPAGTGLVPLIEVIIDVSVNGVRGYEVDHISLSGGRLPAPTAADEAVVSPRFSAGTGIGLGDELVLESMTHECVIAFFFDGDLCEPSGPRVPLRVVGIGATPEEVLSPTSYPAGGVFLGPGFHRRWAGEVPLLVGSHAVRLVAGPGGVAGLDSTLPEDSVAAPRTELLDRTSQALRVQEAALWIATAVAGLVGAAILAQAVARHVSRRQSDHDALRAIGRTAGELRAQGLLTALPVAAGGWLLGTTVAAVAAPAVVFGVAGRLDPDPPFGVEVVAAAAAALVLVVACTAAWVVAVSRGGPPAMVHNAGRWGLALARSGAPLSVVVGARHALEHRADATTSVPTRSSLAGIVLGLGGVAAALSFGAGLTRLADDPARQGTTFDLEWGPGDEAPDEQALAGARTVADLAGTADVGLARISQVRVGGREVDGYGWLPVAGDPSLTMVAGRFPTGSEEVALGPLTMADLGVGIGDEVALPDGADDRYTIVGAVLVPALDSDESPGRGLAVAHHAAAGLLEHGFPVVLVTATAGTDLAQLRDDIEGTVGGFTRRPPSHASVANLAAVRGVPLVLAVGLAALAVAATIHAIATSIRRRRRSLALLRALGFRDRQVRATVVAQALTLIACGAAIGIPLGVAVGRAAWRPVADAVGVASDPVTPALLLTAILAIGVALALACAAVLTRSAVRVPPSLTLRTE